MSLLKIAQLGHPVLREKTQPVSGKEVQSREFQQLIDDMFATLEDTDRPGWTSVGLAAPQVYVPKRVFVVRMEVEDKLESRGSSESSKLVSQELGSRKLGVQVVNQVFINPEIVKGSDKKNADFEACLSLPDILGVVERPVKIKVKALNRKGEEFTLEAKDFYARVILHETDHLDGILFPDQMRDMTTLTFIENLHRQYQTRL